LYRGARGGGISAKKKILLQDFVEERQKGTNKICFRREAKKEEGRNKEIYCCSALLRRGTTAVVSKGLR